MFFVLSSSSQVAEDVKSAKEEGKSSLVFVFDTTGSMYDDLKQLREGAEMIMDTALEESDVVSNFVFVPFHDPGKMLYFIQEVFRYLSKVTFSFLSSNSSTLCISYYHATQMHSVCTYAFKLCKILLNAHT